MSIAIYGKLNEAFVLRMRNWALSNAGVGIQHVTSSYEEHVADGEYVSRMPILIGEAEDTNGALNTLDVRYKLSVSLFWQHEGKALAWLSRRCGCDWRTYEVRVMTGHDMLRAELYRIHDRISAYRRSAEIIGKPS